jgi:hypothetical protein
MKHDPDSGVSAFSPNDQRGDGEAWLQLLGGSLQRPRAMESTTLTALLLLFLVAAEDKGKALPASGRVLNLVTELQQHQTGGADDTKLRASLIARLSAALTGLRNELG